MLEKELEHLNTKTENPVLVEDLQDIVVESALTNVRCLLIIIFSCHTQKVLLNKDFPK